MQQFPASWRSEFNEQICTLDAAQNTRFASYVAQVDDICSRFCLSAGDDLGETAAMLLLLKVSNLLVAKYEHKHQHLELISHPIGLLVDPANACSLSCPGCVHSDVSRWSWPSGLLKESVFQSFMREHGPFACEAYLANYGEPLLNRMTPRFIEFARTFGLPTYTSSSLSVPSHLISGIVESGLSFLIVSIDGATDETYSRFRRNGSLQLAIDNVRAIVDTKRRLSSYAPVLHWQFLVFEHNRHEIDAVTCLARDLGVNQLALARPFSVEWDDPTVRAASDWDTKVIPFERDRDAFKAHLSKMRCGLAKEVITEKFLVTWTQRLERLKGRVPLHLAAASTRRQKPCDWLYKSLTIDALGRIMPCARAPSPSGDLLFSRYDKNDQFNSQRHQLARQIFVDESSYREKMSETDVEPPYCEKCEHRNQKVDIDTKEVVRNVLENFDLFDPLSSESKDVLTNW